jgi:hypothetical protein
MKKTECEEYTQLVDGLYFKQEGVSVQKTRNVIVVEGPNIFLEIDTENKTFGFCEHEG